ncbi:condensation domain-containing protein [Vibrio sp. ED004]|uniref:condensation domain-containing protein n=1 Tax=Vibrio sp. ED004 TaxID=2785124 RepID=UPI0024A707F2|nr:condensation domain-containing protein [Vibrio sp. ED004]
MKSFTEQALQRQGFPFEMLVESLGITGNLRYHPVFQTSFNFQSFDEQSLFDWQGLDVEPFDPGVVNAQLEIGMDIQQMSESKWLGFVSYVSPIFTQDFAQALLEHWLLLLDRIATNSDKLVSQLHLIDENATQQSRAFNNTSLDWGTFVTPSQAIQQQAEKHQMPSPYLCKVIPLHTNNLMIVSTNSLTGCVREGLLMKRVLV